MTYFNQLKGKAALVGLMFLVGGGIYSFTAPLWGYLTDKKVCLQNQVYKNFKSYDRIFKASSECNKTCIIYIFFCESVHCLFYHISQNAKVLFQGYVKTMIGVGNLVAAVGYLLMGPTPLISDLPL